MENQNTPVENNNEVQPQIINSRTMIPIRAVTEALGREVTWDDNTKTAIVTYYDTQKAIAKKCTIQIGSTTMQVEDDGG